jgi:hypothetical protein
MESEWSQSKVVHQQFFNKFDDDFDEVSVGVGVGVGVLGREKGGGG